MRPRTTPRRLLGALAVALTTVLVLAPQAQAQTTPPQPSPPPTPAPATSALPVPGPPPTVTTAKPAPAAKPARPADGQVSRVPQGAPQTGGGATADDGADATVLLVLGGLGLAGAATAVATRRRVGAGTGADDRG